MITVKVTARRDATPQIFRIDTFPVHIGRSLQNHIVISDDSVSIDHAQLEQRPDGIYLKDLNSSNGIWIDDKQVFEKKLDENVALYLGDVRLEIIVADKFVEKTRIIERSEDMTRESMAQRFITIGGLIIISSILGFVHEYISVPLNKVYLLKFLGTILAIYLSIGIVAGFASFLSKVITKRYFFYRSFRRLLLFFLVMQFFYLIQFVLIYQINSQFFTEHVCSGIEFGLAFIGVFLVILEMFNRTSPAKLFVFQGMFLGLIFIIILLGDVSEDSRFSYEGHFSYPISNYSQITNSQEKLFELMDESFVRLGELRKEELKKREE